MANRNTVGPLKVGDRIAVGGIKTELKAIKFDPCLNMNLYWFYNERGEYKYNIRESIIKLDK